MNSSLQHSSAPALAGVESLRRLIAPLLRWTPGLLLCAGLAMAATVLGRQPWIQAQGLSPLSLAIVLGMLVGNSVYGGFTQPCASGVQLAKQRLLRLGVVFYGLRLTLQDIGQLGLAGVLVDALVLCSTFALACLLGTRWLGLDRKTAMLIGAGSSICGAAAVMATEPVLRARDEQVGVAVATVVLFGTVAIFLYPALYHLAPLNGLLPADAHRFGVYIGSTVHEVAQVVAAARSIDETSADSAVIAKMVRVMMLAPFLIGLSAWQARRGAVPQPAADTEQSHAPARLALPWFALAFVAMVGFNSLHWLPRPLVTALTELDTFVLAVAMAALGLGTQVGAVRRAGTRPLLLAGLLFAWLVFGGALLNKLLLG